MDQAPSSATPNPAPFPVHALWFGLSAGLCLLAAIATSDYNRAALAYGLLAIIAIGLGLLLAKLAPRCALPGDAPGALPPAWLLSLAAGGGLCLLFAVLARRVAREYTGFKFIDGVYAFHEGLFASSVSFGLVLLALAAFWLWRWRQTGLPGGQQRRAWITLGIALAAFLLGPRLEFRLMSPEGLFAKRGLIEVLKQPFGRTAGLKLEDSGQRNAMGETEIVSCVFERGWAVLFFARTRELEAAEYSSDEDVLRARAERCRQESDAALISGAAPEALLYQGDVAGYLARVMAASSQHPVGARADKLPAPLGPQLLALLPESQRMKYQPFDVALAAGLKEQALALMPAAEAVMPYQRHALFGLGLASLLDGEAGKTAESIAEERRQTAQSMLQIGSRLGSADIMRNALMYGLSPALERENFTGGYTGYDFYYANRSCDLPYAEFLAARGLQPEVTQRLHLLSSIGLAQYPPGYGQQGFKYAEISFGHPTEPQLAQCLTLARWYASKAPEASAEEIDAIYAHIGSARMAWFDLQRNTPGKDLPGSKGLTTRAAVAMLERQPPSFPQYCAWTNTIFWSLIEPEASEGPFALDPLLALQTSWKGRDWADLPLATKTDSWGEPLMEFDAQGQPLPARCQLQQMPYSSQPAKVLASLNRRLKELGVPCQGVPDGKHPQIASLTCQKP